jgi:hypothetical protein
VDAISAVPAGIANQIVGGTTGNVDTIITVAAADILT